MSLLPTKRGIDHLTAIDELLPLSAVFSTGGVLAIAAGETPNNGYGCSAAPGAGRDERD